MYVFIYFTLNPAEASEEYPGYRGDLKGVSFRIRGKLAAGAQPNAVRHRSVVAGNKVMKVRNWKI